MKQFKNDLFDDKRSKLVLEQLNFLNRNSIKNL